MSSYKTLSVMASTLLGDDPEVPLLPAKAKLPRDFSQVVLTLDNALISDEKLSTTPSRSDGVSEDMEMDLRIYGTELIQTSGILLKLPQVAMATGQVLFQRFYYCKSFVKHSAEVVAMSCIYLASKIEEEPRRIRDVVAVFHHMKQIRLQKRITSLMVDSSYVSMKNQVIKEERRLLKELGFSVHVKHSHKMIVMYLQVLEQKNRQLIQCAWNYVNDSYRTSVFVRYPPETIACACIYLAARKLQISLPNSPPWYALFGVIESDMKKISLTVLNLYTRAKPNPEELEKKMTELRKLQKSKPSQSGAAEVSTFGTPTLQQHHDSPAAIGAEGGQLDKRHDTREVSGGAGAESNGKHESREGEVKRGGAENKRRGGDRHTSRNERRDERSRRLKRSHSPSPAPTAAPTVAAGGRDKESGRRRGEVKRSRNNSGATSAERNDRRHENSKSDKFVNSRSREASQKSDLTRYDAHEPHRSNGRLDAHKPHRSNGRFEDDGRTESAAADRHSRGGGSKHEKKLNNYEGGKRDKYTSSYDNDGYRNKSTDSTAVYEERGRDKYEERGRERYKERDGDKYAERSRERYAERGGDRYKESGEERYAKLLDKLDKGSSHSSDKVDKHGRSSGSSSSSTHAAFSYKSRDGSDAHANGDVYHKSTKSRDRKRDASRDDRKKYDRKGGASSSSKKAVIIV